MRRHLTRDFIEGLSAPTSGEVWIADTEIPGFGVRLWATKGNGGAAYGIRTNANGRIVRKSFSPNAVKFLSGRKILTIKGERGNSRLSKDHILRLSWYLDEARDWAQTEIGRLKGRQPSEVLYLKTLEAERIYRQKLSSRLTNHKLKFLVEKILEYGYCRGWNESYRDRLRQAFESFDRTTGVGSLTIQELRDGRLLSAVTEAQIGLGTLRLVKSILKPVSTNLHFLTDVASGRLFPRDGRGRYPRPTEMEKTLESASMSDFEALLRGLAKIDYDWRSTVCIELCFRFNVPVQRVLTARWSQIRDGRWWPYNPAERTNSHFYWQNIHEREFELLTAARQKLIQEKIASDFWFPNHQDPQRSIKNVDRAWLALIEEAQFPKVTLSSCCRAYRYKRPIWFPWLSGNKAIERQREIEKIVSAWAQPYPQSGKNVQVYR